MKFDFDKVVDRHGTKCLKYDFAKERGRSDDMLPLWVADNRMRRRTKGFAVCAVVAGIYSIARSLQGRQQRRAKGAVIFDQ